MDGFSMEVADRRVDRLLSRHGITGLKIFYSPISIWFVVGFLFFVALIPVGISILFKHFSVIFSFKVFACILVYLLISYLLIAIFNRSFAIAEDKIMVVNSHFPFGWVKPFYFKDITEVKISSDWRLKPLMLFGLAYANYVQLKIGNEEKRFYCSFLDVDCHDENWTERTLDDLHKSLENKGVKVVMEI